VQAHGAAITFPHCGTVPHPLLCTLMHLRARRTHRPDRDGAAVVQARVGQSGGVPALRQNSRQYAAHEACSF